MILTKQISPHIVLLQLNNPPANSLSRHMKVEFLERIKVIEEDRHIRALILTGSGDKFCSGDDLKEAISNSEQQDKILKNLQAFGKVVNRFEQLPIPIIAAINGWCIGGGVELALCCDIRIAAEDAQFVMAGVNVGLTASGFRLPKVIGVGRAKRLLLTGEPIDAFTAEKYGLITDIFPNSTLLEEAIQLAKSIAQKAPLAIKATKRIVNQSLESSHDEGLAIQQRELLSLAHSQDHREALAAFAAKRKPIFKGN